MMSELERTNRTDEAENSPLDREIHPRELMGIGGAALVSEGYHHSDEEDRSEVELDAEQKMKLAEKWLSEQDIEYERFGPIPSEIASEVSILAQKRYNLLDEDGFIDEEMTTMQKIRDQAIEVAEVLDFELVELAGSWALHARLNRMHEKFTSVSPEQLSRVLDVDDRHYEYKAFRLCNIIADHAPALLTENLRALVDPNVPVWRACSAHASILLRSQPGTNIEPMQVDRVASSLPASSRTEHGPEDTRTMKPLHGMGEEELALYCRPEAIDSIREKGFASFSELNAPAREAQLTHRLFEAVAKSQNPDLKRATDERNRSLEHETILQEGDLTHATGSPEVFENILANGLRCGEAIMGNDRATIKYPFTVSFLEVSEKVAQPESMPERLNLLRNNAYGSINMVLHRDAGSTEVVRGQATGVVNQRQVFGGLPATEIKSVVIRDSEAPEQTTEKVIKAIVENGMFIPVYSGTTGESLLTSEQFDQMMKTARR